VRAHAPVCARVCKSKLCTEVKYGEVLVNLKCRDVCIVHWQSCEHCSYVIYLAQVYFMLYNREFVILCVCVRVGAHNGEAFMLAMSYKLTL
jgi:hypothetical protein